MYLSGKKFNLIKLIYLAFIGQSIFLKKTLIDGILSDFRQQVNIHIS